MEDRQWDTYDPAAEPGVKPFTGWENYGPGDSGTEENREDKGDPAGSSQNQEESGQPDQQFLADTESRPGASEERAQEQENVPAQESVPETEEGTEKAREEEEGRDWEIGVQLTQLNLRLEQLDRKFNEKIRVSESQDIMAKTLYAEVQEYKKGMYADILKPLLLELVQLRNNILRQCRSIMEKEGEDAMIAVGKLMDYGEDIGDVLETYDVEIFHGAPGTDFDSRLQKLLKKVPTADEAMNKKVAASLCDGYRYKGRTIMKENVKVYAYEPEKTAENT